MRFSNDRADLCKAAVGSSTIAEWYGEGIQYASSRQGTIYAGLYRRYVVSVLNLFFVRVFGAGFCLAVLFAGAVQAGQARVAVAANFLPVLRELGAAFAAGGHHLQISSGSTGKLYAQIVHGAPFDLFLAADQARPERLEREGRIVPGSRFTYAIGHLVLWSPAPERFSDGLGWLREGRFQRLAIANPKTAPYGRAARQFLRHHDLWVHLQAKLVRGESVSQALQFVASGNADAGLVALSQVNGRAGSRWLVPATDHDPIVQQAVLLVHGADNPAARAFYAFLQSPPARRIIRAAGYILPALGP